MRHFSILLAAPVIGSASCARASSTAALSPSANDLATARAEITPQLAEMLAAANAHDTDRHLRYYVRSPDLVFAVNDEVIRGYDSLRVRQLGWWLNGKSDVAYSLGGEPTFAMPVPGTVIQTYALVSRRTAPDGSTRTGRIAVTTIWEKRAEGWRIVYAQETSVPTPAKAP